MSPLHRRHFLLGSLAVGACGLTPRADAAAPDCGLSVPTGAGPFYPGEALRARSDLILSGPTAGDKQPAVATADAGAVGAIIELSGVVRGPDCQPLADAAVEIWQADAAGRYKHDRAGQQDALDPHFGYFGCVRSDAHGRYRFRTIVPTRYRFAGVLRAPHIHFRVAHRDHGALITEMYFAGPEHDAARARDRVFQGRAAAREQLIIAPSPAPSAVAATPRYQFDLALTG